MINGSPLSLSFRERLALGVVRPVPRVVSAPVKTWRRALAALQAQSEQVRTNTVCIDFDGTMTEQEPYRPGLATAPAQAGMFEGLRALWRDGYRLVVLTARPPGEVHSWLTSHGVSSVISEVTNTKPPAVAYLDDRAVPFESWPQAVNDVRAKVVADRLERKAWPIVGNDAEKGEQHAAYPAPVAKRIIEERGRDEQEIERRKRSADEFHRRLKRELGQEDAAPTLLGPDTIHTETETDEVYGLPPCKDCGGEMGLMPPDFETLRCEDCEKNQPFAAGEPVRRSRPVEETRVEAKAQPTAKEREAGNYPKRKLRVHGMEIAIENEAGSYRESTKTDDDGKPLWRNRMANPYGYIKGTVGRDKDHLDVFLGPDLKSDRVFVVNQIAQDGSFDEHKCMLGFGTLKSARRAYLRNYPPDWQCGDVKEMSIDEFKEWAFDGPKNQEAAANG